MVDFDTTTDMILGGRVTLKQPAKGYRVAIDPVLLAAFVPAIFGERVLEIGCGTGAAILALNARMPGLKLTAIEPDADMRALAIENAALNGAEIEILEGAVGDVWPVADNAFDHVLFNPPFFDSGLYWPSPHKNKTQAHKLRQPLGEWVKAARRALAGEGMLSAIITVNQLPEFLEAAYKKMGAIVMQPLIPREGALVERMLVRARLGRKTSPIMRPPIIVHRQENKGYTPLIADVLCHGGIIK